MSKVNSYHRLSVQDKIRYHRDTLREPPVRCPACEMGMQPEDLPGHMTRCQGRAEPHQRARWITWSEASAFGVRGSLLSYWARRGHVRVRQAQDRREYLYRDVATLAARRDSKRLERQPKRLTNQDLNSKHKRMGNKQLDERRRNALKGQALEAGGVEALGRKLDIPTATLRRAIAGGELRAGTIALIEQRMSKHRASTD